MQSSPEHHHENPMGWIIKRAERLLKTPDHTSIMLLAQHRITPGYTVEFRATNHTPGTLLEGARYMYVLSGTDACKPVILSLDVESALASDEDEPYRGGVYQPDKLSPLLHTLEGNDTLGNYIGLVALASDKLHSGLPLTADEHMALATGYPQFLDNPLIQTQKAIFRDGPHGSELEIIYQQYEGALEFARESDLHEPALKVRTARDGIATVLEQYPDGHAETYTERQDFLEELASVVGEQDVQRDDDGTILLIEGGYDELRTVRAAERAAGNLPLVQHKHLAEIARQLAAMPGF